jgi:hypothetical protein
MADSTLNVYLDQRDWIVLLKADAGKPERPAHADALTLLRAAVAAGKVSLPLSHVHYQETSHRKPFAKRVELAKLMAELSRFHSIESRSLVSAKRRSPARERPKGRCARSSADRRRPRLPHLRGRSRGRMNYHDTLIELAGDRAATRDLRVGE